jgi:hypothetical protein
MLVWPSRESHDETEERERVRKEKKSEEGVGSLAACYSFYSARNLKYTNAHTRARKKSRA